MSNYQDASEHAHQVTLMQWFDKRHKKYAGRLIAIPNGGHRAKSVAVKLKAEGVKKGVPDMFLPVASNGYYGLFIELKKIKGRATSEQKEWINNLNEAGYLAVICEGWESASVVILDYLNNG